MSTPDPVDAAGTRHAPAGPEARIVSLVPSITELLFDMELGPQVVGRTHYCIHPDEPVKAIPSLGGTKKINLMRLVTLAPSHVIVNVDENTREMAAEIDRLGIEVIVTHPLAPQDNLALYRLIGHLFGKAEQAALLCARFEAAGAALGEAARGWRARRVLYLIWRKPWMTVSRATYVSRVLNLVGWQTVADDPDVRYPSLEITGDLLAATDMVLFSSEPYAFDERHIEEFRAAHQHADVLLSLIDGEMVSWYGSRAIRGLAYLREFATARHSEMPSQGPTAGVVR